MQRRRKVVETALGVVSVFWGVGWNEAPLTESEVCKQDGRLDAADVGVVHDLDSQSCLDEVYHVVGGKKDDWESNVVGTEDEDVGEVSDCEELG